MEAHIERDWIRRTVKVWIYERAGGGHIVYRQDGDEWKIAQGELLPDEPTFVFPESMLEAIVKESSGFVQASDATVDALKDAREVRDRLLAIVEREPR